MKRISAEKYVEGVKSIYVEKPVYELGHDGSDGKCDCIGMGRGGLKRGGATDIKNMSGTNQAARKTIRNLQKLESSVQLCVGDVVLKVRDKDDKNMPLPDRYRKGGADYDPTWGETNFTHFGTVTRKDPLEITHMTSPTAKKDNSIKSWDYFGELPWVEYEEVQEPPPEPETELTTAIVTAKSGTTVKMRAKPSASCRLYWDVPIGSTVIIDDSTDPVWDKITWNDREGYMKKEFLKSEQDEGITLYTVTIPGLPRYKADALVANYTGASMTEERRG